MLWTRLLLRRIILSTYIDLPWAAHPAEMVSRMAAEKTYKAFISYKHVTSTSFAEPIEAALKAYAKPLLSRPIKIFRDEKHLAPGIDLPTLIKEALDASEFLILLASPEAAKSQWVHDELDHWCSVHGRSQNLIVVLLDGQIVVDQKTKRIDCAKTDALPPSISAPSLAVPPGLRA